MAARDHQAAGQILLQQFAEHQPQNHGRHREIQLAQHEADEAEEQHHIDVEHALRDREGANRIYAFHVCDWLVPTTDLLRDRRMMGDGVIDLPRIRGWVEAAGYKGAVEVEIFSAANWWKRDPDEVLAVVKERYRTVC